MLAGRYKPKRMDLKHIWRAKKMKEKVHCMVLAYWALLCSVWCSKEREIWNDNPETLAGP